jgi:hypothetical protein
MYGLKLLYLMGGLAFLTMAAIPAAQTADGARGFAAKTAGLDFSVVKAECTVASAEAPTPWSRKWLKHRPPATVAVG